MTTPKSKTPGDQSGTGKQRSAGLTRTTSLSGEAFAIIEVEDGLTIAAVDPGTSPEEAALRYHGVLIDPGPYKSYEDAYDALEDLLEERDDRE